MEASSRQASREGLQKSGPKLDVILAPSSFTVQPADPRKPLSPGRVDKGFRLSSLRSASACPQLILRQVTEHLPSRPAHGKADMSVVFGAECAGVAGSCFLLGACLVLGGQHTGTTVHACVRARACERVCVCVWGLLVTKDYQGFK